MCGLIEGFVVVEGDESDRTVFGLTAEIAVVTNVEEVGPDALDPDRRAAVLPR